MVQHSTILSLINRAIDPNGWPGPVTYSPTQLSLNDNNSNVSAFISNLPDKITTAATLYTNPQGNVTNYNDFIYYKDGIKLDLDFEMPLNFMADNLSLCHTCGKFTPSTDKQNKKCRDKFVCR